MSWVPSRPELAISSSDNQHRRSRRQGSCAAANGGVGDRDRRTSIQASFLTVQLKRNLAFDNHIELLLSAAPLIVLLDKRLTGTSRDEEVGPERVDPEGVLERIPGGIVRTAV